jgi:hypothetical protein
MTSIRRLIFALLVVLCVFADLPARAQLLNIYVTSSTLHPSNVETGVVYTPATGYQNQYTNFWTSGIGGGVTVNFLPLHIVNLGLDLRGSTRPGTVGADTGMVGIKLGVHPPVIRIKPYIQASAGYVATRTVNVSNINPSPGGNSTTFTNKYAAYEILGGIDYPLVHFIDFRVIEIGGGKVILNGTSNPSLLTINTGLVLHF